MVDPVVEFKCEKLIFHLGNDLFAKLKLSAAAMFLDFNSCCLERRGEKHYQKQFAYIIQIRVKVLYWSATIDN